MVRRPTAVAVRDFCGSQRFYSFCYADARTSGPLDLGATRRVMEIRASGMQDTSKQAGRPKKGGACESMRLSPCVLVQPDGWALGEREGYGGPRDVIPRATVGAKRSEYTYS